MKFHLHTIIYIVNKKKYNIDAYNISLPIIVVAYANHLKSANFYPQTTKLVIFFTISEEVTYNWFV